MIVDYEAAFQLILTRIVAMATNTDQLFDDSSLFVYSVVQRGVVCGMTWTSTRTPAAWAGSADSPATERAAPGGQEAPGETTGQNKTRGYAKGADKSGGNIPDMIMFPKCWLVLPRAQHLSDTKNVSENLLVSALRATMLPRLATDGEHRRTQCCRHNVSSFCRGLRLTRDKQKLLVHAHAYNLIF